ncbi:MAG: MmgE/PrpD family protein, partial [Alphaproteobacteria bacterium]|nr:MmgE/PrpD family protein [Alphaproteobacteria bacterium]
MPQRNGSAAAAHIAASAERVLPPEVADMARLCLADWLGVAIGAGDEAAGRIVREVAAGWRSEGRSTVLFGGTAAAPFAALANGTLAHCLDFDDTYVRAITHTSAPVWAATLALGEELGADEGAMLSVFVTGFETAARIGDGLGEPVSARGWHGTGVFGRLGAAAAASVLLHLDNERALYALGAAATQIGGLTASFGTMAKPFHAGKAAMDGIVSAQLAASGFTAATGLFEAGGGLDTALIQDRSVTFQPIDFIGWRILENSFKPYAACHLTHPAVDAARALAPRVNPGAIASVRAEIGALAHSHNRSRAP